jgi:AcrR family transcriptional regulator
MIGTAIVDRKARRHHSTREEILEAAWALARRHGLGGIAMRDLAAQVGMRQPSLYTYFASKNAIYDAMFEQGWRGLLERLHGLTLPDDARGVLLLGSQVYVEYALRDTARFQLMNERPIPGFEPSAQAYAPAVEVLALFTDALAAHGIGDPRSIDMWTAILAGLVSLQVANEPGGRRWVDLVDTAIDMFIGYTQQRTRGTRR